MDLHVITSRGAVLVAQIIRGKLILPPISEPSPAAVPAQPEPGK